MSGACVASLHFPRYRQPPASDNAPRWYISSISALAHFRRSTSLIFEYEWPIHTASFVNGHDSLDLLLGANETFVIDYYQSHED